MLLTVLRCQLTYSGQVVTNAEARFNKSLRPQKPEGSLGRTAQDVHLDSHTAPELCRNSRVNLHCYTQREASPTQQSARKWRCDLSRLLAQKITKGIHSGKPASLNRPTDSWLHCEVNLLYGVRLIVVNVTVACGGSVNLLYNVWLIVTDVMIDG